MSVPILLPDTLLPIQWHPYLVVVLLLLWPAGRLLDHFLPKNVRCQQTVLPTTWPICCLVCWLPVTLWSSVAPYTSWIVLGYLLLGIICYSTIIPRLPLLVHS
ncbi:MAG: hypothetical protein KDE47_19975, partial [Caldilineaceae bacterium]|nr:hypothetical protein [Caldilineaceae bacterium]